MVVVEVVGQMVHAHRWLPVANVSDRAVLSIRYIGCDSRRRGEEAAINNL